MEFNQIIKEESWGTELNVVRTMLHMTQDQIIEITGISRSSFVRRESTQKKASSLIFNKLLAVQLIGVKDFQSTPKDHQQEILDSLKDLGADPRDAQNLTRSKAAIVLTRSGLILGLSAISRQKSGTGAALLGLSGAGAVGGKMIATAAKAIPFVAPAIAGVGLLMAIHDVLVRNKIVKDEKNEKK